MEVRKRRLITIIICIQFTLVATNSLNAQENHLENVNEKEGVKNDFLFGTAPDFLQKGDLVFCEIRPTLVKWLHGHNVETGFDHVAIYIGNHYGIDWVVEATYLPLPIVRFTPLILLQLYSTVQYAAVKDANNTVKRAAMNFAVSQNGKPYQHILKLPDDDLFRWNANNQPNDSIDPYSKCWYCAELVWASYYNQGIDLDTVFPEARENNYIEDYGYLRFVTPQNIFDSTNTTVY